MSCEIDHCSSCDFLTQKNSSDADIVYTSCTQCDPTFSPIEWYYWIDDLKKVEDVENPVYVNRTICQPADHCEQKDGQKCIRCMEPFYLDINTHTCVESCHP